MKKIFAVILIISILFSFQIVSANSINLIVESKTATYGDEVAIDILLNNNTGIIAALLQLEYDSSRLKLTDVKDGKLLQGATFNPDYNKIPYTMLWNSATATNFTDDGILATLTFNVLETAPNGEAQIKLSYNENDVFDVDLNNVALNIVNGAVTVTGQKAENATQSAPENEEVFFENEPNTVNNSNSPVHNSTVTSENAIENKIEIPAFTDANIGDWYYDAVNYAVRCKLMNGVSKTSFSPNTNLTRAMLVTILYRNENEPEAKKDIPFTDVDTNSYYANAVSWAQANNIVSGTSETSFAPDLNITREQIATILYRYAKYKNYDVSIEKTVNSLSYSDSTNVSPYAVEAMQYAVDRGIITGKSEKTLNPHDNATRAEAATILMRFLEYYK